jgi:hypothetical protein
MKKLLLLSAVLVGAVTASQAGVRFDIGIGQSWPPPLVIRAPAPVYVQPAPICAPAPYVVAPPAVVVAPPVVDFRFGHEPYWQHFRDEFHHDRDYHNRR